MSRLTAHNYEHDLFRDIYCKLQDLENIEEELGIDLITLFKASENGFYMINEGQIKFVKQGYQFNLRGRYIHLNSGYKELDFKLEDKPFSDILLFKDYGTTWSLDIKNLLKENLENE